MFLVQRNPAALWFTKMCLFQWKLRKKELKTCRWKCQIPSCIWKKLQFKLIFTAFYLPAARLPKLTSKLERLDCSYLFNSKHRSKLSTDSTLLPCWKIPWHSKRMRQSIINKRNYHREFTRVVYHLHGETGWSMVCANGKQNSHLEISVWGRHVLFEQHTQHIKRPLDEFDIFKMPAEIRVSSYWTRL